jgi:hypothetical protein
MNGLSHRNWDSILESRNAEAGESKAAINPKMQRPHEAALQPAKPICNVGFLSVSERVLRKCAKIRSACKCSSINLELYEPRARPKK